MSETPPIHIGVYQLMPDMSAEEFAALKTDIAARGVISPIDVDETGAILDVHHRFRAWCELQRNEPPPTIVRAGLTEDERRSFAIRQNLKRRHLSRAQVQGLIERELKERPDRSDRKIGADLGVDHKTIGRLRRVLNATGEVPQLDATTGADGRMRSVKRKAQDDDDAKAWACAFGGRVVKAKELPTEVQLAMFQAGLKAKPVAVFQSKPFHLTMSEEQIRDWELFGGLLETKLGWSKEAIGDHFNWVIDHHGYKTPDEWLGEDGAQFRKRCLMREPSDEFKEWWKAWNVA